MIELIKKSAFETSSRLGLTSRFARSAWRRRRLLVLCYHGISVADEHEWNPELYISPRTFARRLDSLDRLGCSVLPLDEAIERLYRGTLPDSAVALTFDDGFYDFKAAALPALEARGYPATIYVTTQRCHHQDQVPVAHLLASYLVWKKCGLPAHARLPAQTLARVESGRLHPEDERVFARELSDRLDAGMRVGARRLLCVMSPDDLREVAARGVAVEMHTHRHWCPEDPDEFVEEVRMNRAALHAITGHRPRHLCYPNGRYRAEYLSNLEREGISTATTCDPALASADSHRLLLPRFVDNETVAHSVFEAWVTGIASWLPRRTRRADVH